MNKLNFALIEMIFPKFFTWCNGFTCCQHFKKLESCLREILVLDHKYSPYAYS